MGFSRKKRLMCTKGEALFIVVVYFSISVKGRQNSNWAFSKVKAGKTWFHTWNQNERTTQISGGRAKQSPL